LSKRAKKYGLTLDGTEELGRVINRLDDLGANLSADNTVAKALFEAHNQLEDLLAFAKEGISPYWSSSAKIVDPFGSPKIMGFHCSAMSTGQAMGFLLHQNDSPLAHNDYVETLDPLMVASNLLRMMFAGSATFYHFDQGHIPPRTACILKRPEVQVAIAEEVRNLDANSLVLSSRLHLLNTAFVFWNYRLTPVVDAFREHPLVDRLTQDGPERLATLQMFLTIVADSPHIERMEKATTFLGDFLGLDALDPMIDQAFGKIVSSPLTNETQSNLHAILTQRAMDLQAVSLEHQGQAWLPGTVDFLIEENYATNPHSPLWDMVAQRPQWMQSSNNFLPAIAASKDYFQGTLTILGTQKWFEVFNHAYCYQIDTGNKDRSSVFAKLDKTVLASSRLGEYFLPLLETEIASANGALHFVHKPPSETWQGNVKYGIELAKVIGCLCLPTHTPAQAMRWVKLLQHWEYQEPFLSVLPTENAILEHLGDTGRESLLMKDLGL
jgi:hypothetical protein